MAEVEANEDLAAEASAAEPDAPLAAASAGSLSTPELLLLRTQLRYLASNIS